MKKENLIEIDEKYPNERVAVFFTSLKQELDSSALMLQHEAIKVGIGASHGR